MDVVYAVLHRTDARSNWSLFCVYARRDRAETFIKERLALEPRSGYFKVQKRAVL